ncbi:hypothetical protein CAPTEDRAFT_136866 [Capitella teleta]|uniref:ETS domain-containing protein n=1 Tax=Capitella teleta TaxID=283909 RepID=R7V048_CAPTE|nr:hypothetical protein CAPTEDRAFT_136866 [Capitella teleta]|eukprot:ELU09562.1 hypothetical protein CAPTEDRAFT_136866 [Capitella teleta]
MLFNFVSDLPSNATMPPLTPGTNQKMSQALMETFKSFEKEQLTYGIPKDPSQWAEAQVSQWLHWAIREFSMEGVTSSNFKMDGRQLTTMGREAFLASTPPFVGDILWEHLEILQKADVKPCLSFLSTDSSEKLSPVQNSAFCSVALCQNASPASAEHAQSPSTGQRNRSTSRPVKTEALSLTKIPSSTQSRSTDRPLSWDTRMSCSTACLQSWIQDSAQTNPTSRRRSGPIQLWQFLLEQLTDKHCQHFISWTGDGWEFKLSDPDEVARRWGIRKNKPKMNYEKLSRGLRYYYDKNIIHKTAGKRYVYRFVCDLQSLLGYTPEDLFKACNLTPQADKDDE